MAVVPANDHIDRVRGMAKRFASGFTPGQKAVTVAAVAAVAIGAVVFMSMSGKPTYAPLFTNLQPANAATVTAKLQSDGVPFQLSNNGATVSVPENDVAAQRLAIAEAGDTPQSTTGLSILDKEGITASNATQQADYLQAIQGELEQTIDAIAGVASSQVTVAMPVQQTFSLTSNTPTGASVLVTMDAGQTLTAGEVQAIVDLVGSSVPGLSASKVTVADSNGNLLAGPGVAAGGGTDNATQTYDAATQAKVQAYLAAVLGQNNADVQVNATLNYDQVSTTTQSIVPGTNGQPVNFCTSTTSSNQTYTGSGAPPGGAAGTIVAAPGTGTGTYNQSSTSKTCETNQQTTTDKQAPGTVKSQSVAVLVNSSALPKGVSMAQLQAGVAAAAGINTARGDTLAFSAMPFSTAAAKAAAAQAAAASAASKKQSLMGEVKVAVVVLAVLLALFLLWRSSRKLRASTSVLEPISPMEALGALSMPAFTGEPTGQLPVPQIDVQASLEAASVNSFIDAQPDEVATMLRSWLTDRRGVGA